MLIECTQNGYKEYRAMKGLDKIYSIEQLILIAIWRSFHPNEQILGLHQLFLRKLTPTETMSRHNINLVLMTGLVKVSDRYDEPGLFLSIKGGKPYFTAIRSADRKLRIQAASKSEIDSDEQLGKLLDLVFDLLSATIVEYVKFFSDREKLTVLRFDYKSPALRVFFENLSLSQTFMLFWRSVKNCAEEQRSIEFNQIVDRAYGYFEYYSSAGKEIQSYPRPKLIRRSQLEKIVFFELLGLEEDPDLLPNIHEFFIDRTTSRYPAGNFT
jgi:hypothetical protein